MLWGAFFCGVKMRRTLKKKRTRASEKKSNIIEVSREEFTEFIKRVYVDGVVESALIRSGGKEAFCTAVDLTNNVLVHNKCSINSDFGELGIGNLGLFYKIISTFKDFDTLRLTVDKDLLNIDLAEHGTIEYLLTSPEMISTVLMHDAEYSSVRDDLWNKTELEFGISASSVEDYTKYVSMLGTEYAKFKVEKNKVYLFGGETTGHMFRILVHRSKEIFREKFEVKFLAEYLRKVFSVLDTEQDIDIALGPDIPVVIEQQQTGFILSAVQ